MRANANRIITTQVTFTDGIEKVGDLFVVRQKEGHYDDAMQLLVHSVGPDVRDEDIVPGCTIITRGMAGSAFTHDKVDYIAVTPEDALAVVTDTE